MLTRIMIAGAILAASAAPGFAQWNVLQAASSGQCYAANRLPGPSEMVVEGNFLTQQEAHARIDQLSACDRALGDLESDENVNIP